jgi:Radical SAM superfamily
MQVDTIDLLSGSVFQVGWDLGRRCNYDCSYCPSHRHDNFSPHAPFAQLIKNVDFLYRYIDLYSTYRSTKKVSINFTGGEPTVHPNFIQLIEYLSSEYQDRYADRWQCGFTVTSNGAMSERMATAIMDNMGFITISYHAEADAALKQQVLDRIEQFRLHGPEKQCGLSINVMFHAEHFDECADLCKLLEERQVKYVPRIIGEEPDSPASQAHLYTDSQLAWFRDYWARDTKLANDITTDKFPEVMSKDSAIDYDKRVVSDKSPSAGKTLGSNIGRPCCGSRLMCLGNNTNRINSKFVASREFQGWHCSVNWFFLHLEQHSDSVYHHQTCQARFDGTRGAIGRLSNSDQILDQLSARLAGGTMSTIICPKKTCGCGLCAPKSANLESYKQVLYNHVDRSVFANSADF